MPHLFDQVVLLLEEIECGSLLGLKGSNRKLIKGIFERHQPEVRPFPF